MKPTLMWRAATLGMMLASCAGKHDTGEQPMDEGTIRKDLEVIAAHRVFFGHQSVGVDIMEGVRELNAATGSTVRFAGATSDSLPAGPWCADAIVGRNGDPASKCAAFAATVDRLSRDSLELAVLKFCYVDIKPGRDIDSMFREYERTVMGLKQSHPALIIVHATVPLTERAPWWKRAIRKVLGREETTDESNAGRARFNEMLTGRFGGEPLFDIARLESTYPDGTRCGFDAGGRKVYSLIGAYTRDGGHFNDAGRRLAAAAFVRTLAGALGEKAR
ncbi:MAG TPA: hypothetical protein VMM80_04635 [Bacteroidota bacterium]|nr:hypothetical protein [Bacteroidota bacterium]